MAELADATDLGSVALRGVEVQILSSALSELGCGKEASPGVQLTQFSWARGLVGRRLLCTQEIAGSNPAGSTSGTFSVRKGSDKLSLPFRLLGEQPGPISTGDCAGPLSGLA